jgi:nucleotide-binding universal stress UspA family protein
MTKPVPGGPILHPTDFSVASRPAFESAVAMARATGRELLLLHVVGPVVQIPDVYVAAAASYAAWQSAVHAGIRRQMDRLLARALTAGVRATALFVTGLPHEAIVRVARARRVDVIVMGTHGRTGIGRVFLGSVAARVLAQAPCPVLSVRRGRTIPVAQAARRLAAA